MSYKYRDTNVQSLPGVVPYTWVRDYVDYIADIVIGDTGNIYKGEDNNEDLSAYSHDYIMEHLKAKIYDSSITIVLISPNMKEPNRWQRSQWIPWEISYSLRETTRNDRTSHRNAILAVILPDQYGSYDYYSSQTLFPILRDNIYCGYIHVERWDYFLRFPMTCIDKAINDMHTTPVWKLSVLL